MYCDYCGTFTGWDFDKAVSSAGAVHPGAEYEKLAAALSGETEKARASGDRETYSALQKRLFAGHIEHCPFYYSRRVNDPFYKSALVDFMAAQYTLLAFSKPLRQLEAKLEKAMKKVRFSAADRVESPSFRRLYEAYSAYNEAALLATGKEGLFETHPDNPDIGLARLTGLSLFAAAWLPYLSPENSEVLLAETGLKHEYVDIELPPTAGFNCGNCGHGFEAPRGSRRMLCEYCGFMNETGIPTAECPGCGGRVTILSGRRNISCPFCKTEIMKA
ncbi:MAG: hypothetical protein E4H36_08620 [Spirochaetales bacterium]|nr:MAG: hypothetical protein E4H36_08620 [Spirochaetales bacterium]